MVETLTGGSGRVFLTVHGNNGEGNPWSVSVLKALEEMGCTVVVAESLAAGEKAVGDEAVVVSLFDCKRRYVNWFKPVIKSAEVVPNWAWELSNDICFAIGERGVTHAKSVARQIAHNSFTGWVELLLKPPSPLPQPSRPGWRAPTIQWYKPRLRR